VQGQADDYAFMAWGLLELHQATQEPRWLRACERLISAARPLFFDGLDGLYFCGGIEGDPHLPARVKDSHDNVEPAAASVFAGLQLRLWALGVPGAWREDAEKTLRGHFKDLERAPRSLPFMAAALDRALSAPQRLVIAGDLSDGPTQALLAVGRDRWLPMLERLVVKDGEAPFGGDERYGLLKGRAAAYLCRNFVCEAPVSEPEQLAALLGLAG